MEHADFTKLYYEAKVVVALLEEIENIGELCIVQLTQPMIDEAVKAVIREASIRAVPWTGVVEEIAARRFTVLLNLLHRLETIDFEEVMNHVLLKNTGVNPIIVATVTGGARNKILEGKDTVDLAVKGNPSQSHYWVRLGQLIYRCDGSEKKLDEVHEALVETIVRDILVLLKQN